MSEGNLRHALEIDEGQGIGVDLGRFGGWSQTWLGLRYYVVAPLPRDIDILDIAFALGNICRYNGHVRFYSVAEHSVLVSKMLGNEWLAYEGLLHDATEAYLGDITRPVKREMPRNGHYGLMENASRAAIAKAFSLQDEVPEEVLIADAQIVALEKKVLMPRSGEWNLRYPVPTGISIDCLQPQAAQLQFLRRYCELTGQEFAIFEEMYHHFARQDTLAFHQARM